MKLHFTTLEYQTRAVDSVTKLFQGEGFLAQKYIRRTDKLVGDSIANILPVDISVIQENLHAIQKENYLSLTNEADQLQFCIAMETGTGKTYVYIKTIYELHEQYGFTKFIIVVPSIAIREGVQKSFEITHEHFQNLYNTIPIRWFTYTSSRLTDIREFAQSNIIEVMIINIDAFKKSENLIHQEMDRMSGDRPIDLIAGTHPIVIIDEPQSVVNTPKAKEALSSLNPLFVLRYSATHREEINTLYKLTPVDAYQQGLVKQISISSITSQDNFNKPYIRLISVDNSKGYRAKIELDIKTANGTISRTTKFVKCNEELFFTSNERELYSNWQITDIDCEPGSEKIELNGTYQLFLGQAIGDTSEKDIRRAQIRNTIEHHLDKELILLPKKIKVLSLFFIDRVDRYRVYNGDTQEKGEYAIMFEEEYHKLIQMPKYEDIRRRLSYAENLEKAHDGYFSIDKKGKVKDTRGDTSDDQTTYALIMKDKEKLLSMQTPLRFIFSHSALKEGWDNPNVFQVCTLLEQSSALSARQKIGRGLRLCVDQNGERIYDSNLNRLHIIATEHFSEFADKLQKEIEQETGIKFGIIDITTFIDMDIPVFVAMDIGIEIPEETKKEYEEWQQVTEYQTVQSEPIIDSLSQDIPVISPFIPNRKSEPTMKLGHTGAQTIIETLIKENIITENGTITQEGKKKIQNNTLILPPAYQPIANPIINEIRKANIKIPTSDASKELTVKRKEGILDSHDFLQLWVVLVKKRIIVLQWIENVLLRVLYMSYLNHLCWRLKNLKLRRQQHI